MNITIRDCDDWIAVYKDGRKVWETHSCSIKDGLEALGIEFVYEDMEDLIDDNKPEDSFPEELESQSIWLLGCPSGEHPNTGRCSCT